MTERKKPTAGFWITVVVVTVLVGYPLSIGPVVWLSGLLGDPMWYLDIYMVVYKPIVYFDNHEPRWLGRIFASYVEWCRGTNLDHRWSRWTAGAVIGAAIIAFVVRVVNKRAARQRDLPKSPR